VALHERVQEDPGELGGEKDGGGLAPGEAEHRGNVAPSPVGQAPRTGPPPRSHPFTQLEFRGRDGIADWYHQMTDPWERFEAIVEHVEETPRGVKGLLTVIGYRGEEPFHARMGVDCELRNGRIATLTARNAGDVEKELHHW
jgi:hypothetical protein